MDYTSFSGVSGRWNGGILTGSDKFDWTYYLLLQRVRETL